MARHRARKVGDGTLECAVCCAMLPPSSFHKRSDVKWGVDYTCKVCTDRRRRQWAKDHPEQNNKHEHTSQARRKARVLEAYSGKYPACKCCGEAGVPFLTIDHINGGGHQHSKAIGGNLYAWLIRNQFPLGFQVLCFNCNCAKRDTGLCPHQR